MKKLIFTLSLFCLIAVQSQAQYCGDSGPSVCTPSGTLTAPGLSPVSDSLPPLVVDVPTNTNIQFQNFDTLSFGGQTVTLQSLKVDTISNLPAGLCWATDTANNTWVNRENGCINVKGTPTGAPGQYQLHIIVDANIGFTITTNAAAAGLYYYVRMNCSDSAATIPVDTAGQSAGTNTFVAYNNVNCNVGINDINKTVQSLNVFPNPFTNTATVSFNSPVTGSMTEKITTILGSTVYSKQIEVVAGSNSHNINRNNLAAGIYFYTISNGTSSETKKLVIE